MVFHLEPSQRGEMLLASHLAALEARGVNGDVGRLSRHPPWRLNQILSDHVAIASAAALNACQQTGKAQESSTNLVREELQLQGWHSLLSNGVQQLASGPRCAQLSGGQPRQDLDENVSGQAANARPAQPDWSP